MNADVVIVGGGASGLVAGIMCGRRGKNTIILEHKSKPGKKILATGNGKCNYTNQIQSQKCYRGTDIKFAQKVLEQFGVEDTLAFFRELGIYPKLKKGYYYPFSEQSQSILEVLIAELSHLPVTILCEQHVENIIKKEKHFQVRTQSNKLYEAASCILTTGGAASSKLGSDGSGFELAKQFGHKIIPIVPALVGLKAKEGFLKSMSGVRIEATVTLYDRQKKKLAQELGEVQMTDYGVSGIPIMQISRYATYILYNKEECRIQLDFMPQLTESLLEDELDIRCQVGDYKTATLLFTGFLPKKLGDVLLKKCQIELNRPLNKLTKAEKKKLVKEIKAFEVTIYDHNSFENAQVTAGGVATVEIFSQTMESRLCSGLYFAGEIIDIDGTCGGYNLQWAWSSGVIAGRNA